MKIVITAGAGHEILDADVRPIAHVGHHALMHAAMREARQFVGIRRPYRNAVCLGEPDDGRQPMLVGCLRTCRHGELGHAFRAQRFEDGVDAVDAHLVVLGAIAAPCWAFIAAPCWALSLHRALVQSTLQRQR